VLKETLLVALLSLVALTSMIFTTLAVDLVRSGLNIVQLRDILPFVLARSLPYALPTSLLVATVFVFGRLSGRNELIAMRASGVNLNHVIRPLLYVAVLVCAFTFFLNHYLLPWSHSRMHDLGRTIAKQAIRYVGTTHTRFSLGDFEIFVGGLTPDRRFWKNVAVIQFARNDYPAQVLLSERGHCKLDDANEIAVIRLFDGTVFQPKLGELGGTPTSTFEEAILRLDLGREERELPAGFRPEDVALIEKAVRRAVDWAGHPVRRAVGLDAVLFYHDTAADLPEARLGLIRFSGDNRPEELLLAERADFTPAPAREGDAPPAFPFGTWELSRGVARSITRDGLGPAESFRRRTVVLAHGIAPCVPDVGTRPELLWFDIRPKYLTFPQLQEARAALRAYTELLLARPEFADVAHPRSERRHMEKQAQQLFHQAGLERAAAKPLLGAFTEAREALEAKREERERAEGLNADLVERQAAAAHSLKDEADRLETLRERMAKLKATTAEGADAEARAQAHKEKREAVANLADRIRRQEALLEKAQQKLASLREQLEEASAELAALREAEADLARKASDAEEAYRAQEAVAANLFEKGEALDRKARKIRRVERHLVAESQYHFRNAGALTSLVFLIVGIPLGILSRRGNVLMAFALSFMAVLMIYYPLMIVGEVLARDGYVAPALAQWTPNVVMAALGVGLITRGVRR
jgi:lipopolysaccharide export LptBFGC system permease protein LptF